MLLHGREVTRAEYWAEMAKEEGWNEETAKQKKQRFEGLYEKWAVENREELNNFLSGMLPEDVEALKPQLESLRHDMEEREFYSNDIERECLRHAKHFKEEQEEIRELRKSCHKGIDELTHIETLKFIRALGSVADIIDEDMLRTLCEGRGQEDYGKKPKPGTEEYDNWLWWRKGIVP